MQFNEILPFCQDDIAHYKKREIRGGAAASDLPPPHYKNACHSERSDSGVKKLVIEQTKLEQSPSVAKELDEEPPKAETKHSRSEGN